MEEDFYWPCVCSGNGNKVICCELEFWVSGLFLYHRVGYVLYSVARNWPSLKVQKKLCNGQPTCLMCACVCVCVCYQQRDKYYTQFNELLIVT